VGLVQASVTIAICSGAGALGAAVSLRAFGAANGDVFGAVNKLVELAAYATLGVFWT
jgi:cobalamin synthase